MRLAAVLTPLVTLSTAAPAAAQTSASLGVLGTLLIASEGATTPLPVARPLSVEKPS